MPLQAKHIVEEINSERCTIVEKGITASRAGFLRNLLEYNHFEVLISEQQKENEDQDTLFTLGVTNLEFNPVIAVYEMALNIPEGGKISPAYWEQKSNNGDQEYWKESV